MNFHREWLSEPFIKEMVFLHQPPKQTILRNYSQLWTSKEWMLSKVDHSTWPLLRVNGKKNDCPRPFPHWPQGESLSMVHQQSIKPFSLQKWLSDLDHFLNWKMPVRHKSQTTFRTGKEQLILDHFLNWKMTVHKSITHQFSLPTWE